MGALARGTVDGIYDELKRAELIKRRAEAQLAAADSGLAGSAALRAFVRCRHSGLATLDFQIVCRVMIAKKRRHYELP